MSEKKLVSSIKAFERVNKRSDIDDDPIERLKNNIIQIYNKNNNIFSKDGSKHLSDIIDQINQYKAEKMHALAFILGYEIVNKNNLTIDISLKNKISKKSFINYNDEEENIQVFDIIRYARFYISLMKNKNQE